MEKTPTFEQAMARLEEITKQLERGDVPLEESLRYFEEGTALVRLCQTLLDKAEQMVRILSQNQEGESVLLPFDADA
ncbi:MAG TPA: exodeoxyribonuclease VII small subunit [Clostridiales bacterium]|mgnify:CR=1 FL=1|jgi:exodeoxyribonuclease VII small subunit|nr:exodeoxyribonuclease VII small subunit [Clostridiales bacterium]